MVRSSTAGSSSAPSSKPRVSRWCWRRSPRWWHATAYHVKNRGLVIISSCGHAGIINSIRQIQKATGIDKVHAVVGGWHLAPSPEEIVAKTVEAFKQIDPDYLIPMHCTGFTTMMAIQREMPAKLIMPSTGTRVVFGASAPGTTLPVNGSDG